MENRWKSCESFIFYRHEKHSRRNDIELNRNNIYFEDKQFYSVVFGAFLI